MALLVDLFGYLSVVLHDAVIVGQSIAVGSVVFLLLVARPFAAELRQGERLVRRTGRLGAWSAVGLAGCEALTVALQSAVLADTLQMPVAGVLGANFAVAGLLKLAAASALAVSLFRARPPGAVILLLPCLVILAAAVMTVHAVARMADAGLLSVATGLHLLGAAIWIGGLPAFVAALGLLDGRAEYRLVGARFSRISAAGVCLILVSAAIFSVLYIGSWDAAYGTAYGVMVGAKTAMFAALLLLGLGNFLAVERLRRDDAAPVLRLRRFAEVEIGVGLTIFFAAASLTSVPPGADLKADRVTWTEIAERNAPSWPRLTSPEHDRLALSQMQRQLDAAAAGQGRAQQAALVPGSGEIPARNAEDVAWSEFNHHWAGVFVALVGGLALLHRARFAWARHWPLAFVALAGFMAIRSDPEVWPLGDVGLIESLRDVEVFQHRVFALLIAGFGLFEWGVRTGRLRSRRAALVFPLLISAGGALLLTHNHAVSNVREQLLIEYSHTLLALAGVAAGWARWLELRGDGAVRRHAGWVWPACFVLVGAILLNYREFSPPPAPADRPSIQDAEKPGAPGEASRVPEQTIRGSGVGSPSAS